MNADVSKVFVVAWSVGRGSGRESGGDFSSSKNSKWRRLRVPTGKMNRKQPNAIGFPLAMFSFLQGPVAQSAANSHGL